MKKIGVLLAFLLSSAPTVSYAGTGYITHFLTWPLATQADGSTVGVYTAIHVSNISSSAQTVTIVLRDHSGTALANHPVMVGNGPSDPYATTTDANGTLQVSLVGLGSLSVELAPTPILATWGWGTINGTLSGTLIANVRSYGRLPAANYPGTAYGVSLAVNGGNPF